VVGIVALILGLTAMACSHSSHPFDPWREDEDPPPLADTPQGLLRLLEWCYDHRDSVTYRELFTDDYRFLFSAADSAGNPYRDRPFTREDELIYSPRLFREAAEIRLHFDQDLTVLPDPREGWRDSTVFYKSIRTTVNLMVRYRDGRTVEVRGHSLFFVCRGDVALIPEVLVRLGVRADSTRWFINRWEDETAGAGAPSSSPSHRAAPTRNMTWGALKSTHR
jgi:hypothetical protein